MTTPVPVMWPFGMVNRSTTRSLLHRGTEGVAWARLRSHVEGVPIRTDFTISLLSPQFSHVPNAVKYICRGTIVRHCYAGRKVTSEPTSPR